MRNAIASDGNAAPTSTDLRGKHFDARKLYGAPGSPVALRRLPGMSRGQLRLLPPSVRVPRFDPSLLRPGILHLGCGAFHRAHQALFTQEAIEAESGPRGPLPAWGIVSVSLRSASNIRALDQQDGLYTVLERRADGTGATVVASLCHRIFAPTKPELLRHWLANPAIRIVTLTVTPAGYYADPITGRLDSHNPVIVKDLHTPSRRSAIAVLVQAFSDRRAAGNAPLVVLSCDNLASNSRVLRQMCIDFAALRNDAFAAWIAGTVQFPATMVDRIVPTPTDDDRAFAAAATGLVDSSTVSAEPFRQWVIEDFDGPRPCWEAAGAQFVSDVGPWEASKLRLLNGGHLALAFLGLLAGCATVAEAIALPGCEAAMRSLMRDEQQPTLPPSDHDIGAYADELIERWKNPAIAHCLLRVGRGASTKLAARLLAPLRENRRVGRGTPYGVLAVAAWMRCAAGQDDNGVRIALCDPLGEELLRLAMEAGPDAEGLVDRFLGLTEVFGPDGAEDRNLRRDLAMTVRLLARHGARAVLEFHEKGRPYA